MIYTLVNRPAALSALMLLASLPGICTAQSSSGPNARVFAEGIVSTGHEFTLTFSPDGKTAYFTRNFSEPRRNHVMRARFENGQWQEPTRLSFSSDTWSDLDPFVNPDGSRLYFISTRPGSGAADSTAPNMDIWYAEKIGGTWSDPTNAEVLNSPAKEGSPTAASDGTICFFSDRDAKANANAIYCARPEGDSFEQPVKLGPAVNSGTSDTSPFLAPDGMTLLFYSTRDGGYGGGDLYVSFRTDGEWSPAANLGPVVNTDDWEYNPSVSRDGKTLYFGQARNINEIPLETLDIDGLTPEAFTSRHRKP